MHARSKPNLEPPDLVLTWGEQTADLSRQLHGIPSLALGSPRFDTTRIPPAPSAREARAFLGLEPDLTYILFAGASFPFDEMGALNALSAHLRANALWNHRIIYRPHPAAWQRSHSSERSADTERFVRDDPTRRLFDDDDLRQYQFLFKSVAGLIMPYSTMLVEAAMYGVPALAVGYNSRLHPEFDWSANSRHQPHLGFTKRARWVVDCHDESALTTAFADFLDLLGQDTASKAAEADFARLVRVTGRGYGDELIDFVMDAIDGSTSLAGAAS